MSEEQLTHRDIAMKVIKELSELEDMKDKTVLEIGQGKDKEFRKFFEEKGAIYLATDSVQYFEGEEYHLNKMEDLKDFKDESVDFIFSCHAFEHCERPVDALREFKRVLKLDGVLVLVTPWPCKHQIIDADADHIFVLNQYQIARLFFYTGFGFRVIEQKSFDLLEQNFNIISIGIKQ